MPVIAAIAGRHAVRPSIAQRRTNLCLILIPVVVVSIFFVWNWLPAPMPNKIRIASAAPGGVYYRFSNALATRLIEEIPQPVRVLATEGSVANVELLIRNQAEVALVQADIVSSDQISVVAPLYYDAVHVIVRRTSGIHAVADLPGHAVALGADGSGMQQSARRLLSVYEIDPASLTRTTNHFTQLLEDDSLDATIVTTGNRSEDLHRVLDSGEFELLGLDAARIQEFALHDPAFLPITIPAHTFADQSADVPTVATVSFLAVRNRASDLLVRALLESLYRDDELITAFGLFQRRDAAKWRGFAFHPEAHRYFNAEIRGVERQ